MEEACTGLVDRREVLGQVITRYAIPGACLEQGLGDFSATLGGGAQLEEGEGEDPLVHEEPGRASSFPDCDILWKI